MERSIFDLFQRLAHETCDVLAALDRIEGDRELPDQLTYQELQHHAKHIAGTLQNLPQLKRDGDVLASGLRRGNDFYTLFVACSFCQIPFVALSTDLAQQDIERLRNQQILSELKPRVLILHSEEQLQPHLGPEPVFVPTVTFRSLLASPLGNSFTAPPVDPTKILCFQYTGGTTGASRCCVATQQMALWEVVKYKEVVALDSSHRVLQQHSAYWAASLFGEFDIAWAGGCTLVFANCSNVQELANCIASTEVTCAGLVPSVLETLEDSHTLKVVFTWGEALRARTAQSWARRVHLIDLLIASEYWLCLYADWTKFEQSRNGLARPNFQAVSDVQIRLGENSHEANIGEMLLSGPFVCPGYTNQQLNDECFIIDGRGMRWYRTRDCMERHTRGYTFAGRSDEMVKVAGEWVDTRRVVESLCELPGVEEACMHGKAAYVRIAAIAVAVESTIMAELRRQIPPDYALYLVPFLPRTPTGKVDRKALDVMLGKHFTLKAQAEEAQKQSDHLSLIARWYVCLLPLTVGPAYNFLVAEDHFFAFAWMVLEILLRAFLFTYLFLGMAYELRFLNPYLRLCPFDRPGALLLCAGLLPIWTLPWNLPLLLTACPGAWHGFRRQRLLSWPVVVGINFPRMARDNGLWWYKHLTTCKGIKTIREWYVNQMKRNWKELHQWYLEKMGRTRKCYHCKQEKLCSKGSEDPQDLKWYCEACWSHYYKHWQCPSCKAWTLRGDKWQNQWLCSKCFQAKKNAVPPLAVPLLAEVNHLPNALESPPKRQKTEATQEESGPVPMEVTNQAVSPRDLVGAGAVPASASHAADAAAGNGLLQTPRGTEVRPLVLHFARDLDGTMETTGGTGAANGGNGSAVLKSAEWMEVEEALGWSFNSLEDHLLGIDSMRFAKLMSSLLRKGKQLPASAQKCRNLGELLGQIHILPAQQADAEVVGQEWPAWGMMWGSVCGWRFYCQRPISEPVLRRAVQDLISRHVALRCVPADPMELFFQIQAALSVLHLWRVSSPSFARSWLSSLASYSLKSAWPKVQSIHPQVDSVLANLPMSESFEKAEALLSTQAKQDPFRPPFQLRVAPYPGGVVVQLRLTHMFSDGFCIVPLLQDLAKLVADQELLAQGQQISPLPALPVSFDLLQRRLFRTVDGDHSLGDPVTPTTLDSGGWTNLVRSELLSVSPMQVSLIKHAALKLAVPDEILLLTAIGVSMGKVHQQGAQSLHVIAPQRDEPCASDLIGLFADYRRLEVPIEGLHYAGVALALNVIVKERLWRQPPVVSQAAVPFVNFMWTDFEEPNGFKPIPAYKGKEGSSVSPIQVVVVQPSRECWRIVCTFKSEVYTKDQVERFVGYLEESLRCLIEAPLSPTL